jgi:hypothetical protein
MYITLNARQIEGNSTEIFNDLYKFYGAQDIFQCMEG